MKLIKPYSIISIIPVLNGISSGSSWIKYKKARPRNLLDRFLGRTRYYTEYKHLYLFSSKDSNLINACKHKVDKLLFNNIPKGLTVYYTIIGYLPDGSFIGNDYGFEKPTSKDWEYNKHYGVVVNRITYVNSKGVEFEFNLKQIKKYCRKMEWIPVKQLFYGYAYNIYPDLKINDDWYRLFIERLSKDKSFVKNNKGFIVRNETLNIDVFEQS